MFGLYGQKSDLYGDHGLDAESQAEKSLSHRGMQSCMVGLKYPRQFIYPPTFGLVQFGSKPLKNRSVCDLYLIIRLRVIDKCELVPSVKLDVEVLEGLIIELPTIISDNGMGELYLWMINF